MTTKTKTDALRRVAEAKAAVESAVEYSRALQRQHLELQHAAGAAGDRVRRILFEAGRSGEEPKGIDEARQHVATVEQQIADIEVRREGAALRQRESEQVLQGTFRVGYAALAEQRDQVAADLLLERARLDAAQAAWQGQLSEHRSAWAALLDAAAGALMLGDDLSPRQRPERSKYGPGMAGPLVAA